MRTAPSLSVVVPTLNERAAIGGLLDDLGQLRCPHEIIVVDGGSSDDTAAVASARGASVVRASRGRGSQLRAGAAAARAPLLCFLHADVRLSPDAREAIDRLVNARHDGAWAFHLRIDSGRLAYRFVEWVANARSRLLALPYGDQGLLITRSRYEAAGGFPDVPLMEDVLIARALGMRGGIELLPARLIVSPRRWERDGVLRRSVRNLWLLTRFLCGASPETLARAYRP